MISLNDYLYNGDTVVKILHCYSQDLKRDAIKMKTEWILLTAIVCFK